MRPSYTKVAIAVILAFTLLGVGIFVFTRTPQKPAPTPPPPAAEETKKPNYQIIGTSVEGRKIESYAYGSGKARLLFVGGMHGGYEWNSVLLAYQFMDYLAANPKALPDALTVVVIPSLNPDGLFKVTGKEGRFTVGDASTDDSILTSGRFNAHNVDLNRNLDCKWQATSTWRAQMVSGGVAPFSEPETAALRDFVSETKPTAVVFWHSQANAVYASECKDGVLPQTLDIMTAYAKAAGYPAVRSFDAYPVTGDSEGWLASIGIPAITVELKTHETVEWDKNLAGIKALFAYYSN